MKGTSDQRSLSSPNIMKGEKKGKGEGGRGVKRGKKKEKKRCFGASVYALGERKKKRQGKGGEEKGGKKKKTRRFLPNHLTRAREGRGKKVGGVWGKKYTKLPEIVEEGGPKGGGWGGGRKEGQCHEIVFKRRGKKSREELIKRQREGKKENKKTRRKRGKKRLGCTIQGEKTREPKRKWGREGEEVIQPIISCAKDGEGKGKKIWKDHEQKKRGTEFSFTS